MAYFGYNPKIPVPNVKGAIGKKDTVIDILSYVGEDLGVLAENSSLHVLILHCKKKLETNLRGLEKLTQIRQLFLVDFYGSLTPLKKLTELNGLVISGRFCDELVIPPKLEYLSIEGEFDRSLLPLKGSNLSELRLSGEFNRSLKPLEDCLRLRAVTIKGKFSFSLWPLVHTRCNNLQLNDNKVVGKKAVVDFIGCGYPIIPPVDHKIRYLERSEEAIEKFRKEIYELEVWLNEYESKTETKAESGDCDDYGQIYERLSAVRKAVLTRRYALEKDYNMDVSPLNIAWGHKMILEMGLLNLLILKMYRRLDLAKAKRGPDDESKSDIRKMIAKIKDINRQIKSQEDVLDADNIILESVWMPEKEKKALIKEETEAAQKRKDYRRANPEISVWDMKTSGRWPEGW